MCKNACLQCEKLSGLYLQDMQVRKAEENSQTHKFHCKTQHSEWTFTHLQLSPGVLHCHLKTPENKLINFSSEIRPSSCPSVTMSGVLQRINRALLFSYQNITS